MKTICPNCSTAFEVDPEDTLAECPVCNALFDPTPRDTVSVEDALRRMKMDGLEKSLHRNLKRNGSSDVFANVTNAVDKFGHESRKIGCGLMQGIIALPFLVVCVFLLRSCVSS